MRRAALFVMALVLGTCMADALMGQMSAPVVRATVVRPWALATLAAGWDSAYGAHEKAYCVTQQYRVVYPDPTKADSMYVVWAVLPAATDSAGETWITYRCPAGASTIHTHPGHGGPPNCDPSKPDRASLLARGAPFDVVQCGPDTFRFFFPHGD